MSWEIAVALVLLGTIGFVSYFSKGISEDFWYMKLMLFIVGFVLVALMLSFGADIAVSNGADSNVVSLINTAYLVTIWLTIFITFYVVILFIFKATQYFNLQSKRRDDGDDVDEVLE